VSKVTAQALRDIVPMLDRLDSLTPDHDDDSPLYFDGHLTIHHSDDWLIGTAVFEDDQWWVDFAGYGEDL